MANENYPISGYVIANGIIMVFHVINKYSIA